MNQSKFNIEDISAPIFHWLKNETKRKWCEPRGKEEKDTNRVLSHFREVLQMW